MNEALIREYLKNIEQKYAAGNATEHTYRSDLEALLGQLQQGVKATNEPKRSQCGAPDYVVTRQESFGPLTIGYIEAKDVSKPLTEIENDEQLQRYRHALDNLILTDYLEFRWYISGTLRLYAQLGTVDAKKRKINIDANGVQKVGELLDAFLNNKPEPVSKPRELAERMAKIAHMIREIIVQDFRDKAVSELLRDLQSAFKETLLPNLSAAEFADMFAQTLAYGLFAARYNHSGTAPFKRTDAAREIPKTNPFLRKLFGAITGTDIEDEPFIGFVDDLAQLLAQTDMSAVLQDFGKRTRQEDPIVHFYETFLNAYDPKLRELRGVYYTPEPVVSYIVRSADHILKTDFACSNGLADTSKTTHITKDGEQTEESPRVLILDPACGTGTFLYSVINHIREGYQRSGNAGMWSGYVKEHLLPRIFGFELLMAPYAMAHLKLGMQLAGLDLPEADRTRWAYQFDSDERLGIYLTNTLEQAVKQSQILFGGYISNEANEAAKIKQDFPVMVILGNPPYSGHSANTGEWIRSLLHGIDATANGKALGNYFAVDGQPLGERNPKWLNDDYVKFIRFAQWRIEKTGHGVLAFISNHGYIDNPTFRGMRQSLMSSFDDIYILDLHGNSKKKERSPDGTKDENVFDIQQGVAIGIFVRKQGEHVRTATVHHAHLYGEREKKYAWLSEQDVRSTEWTVVIPHQPFYLFTHQNIDLQEEYQKSWKITEIMPQNNIGIVTARDALTIHMTKEDVWNTVTDFAKLSVEKAREKYDLGEDVRDWRVEWAQKDINATDLEKSKILPILYRPFDIRYTYYTGQSRGFHCYPRQEIMHNILDGKNIALITVRRIPTSQECRYFFVTKNIISNGVIRSDNQSIDSIFPVYLYPNGHLLPGMEEYAAGPGGRRPNFSTTFIGALKNYLHLQFISDGKGDLATTFGPEDIFDYMYAVFHSPEYRERYAEFLKIDFPRLPLTSDVELFRELCNLGAQLVSYHLMERAGSQQPSYPEPGNNIVASLRYTAPGKTWENGRVWINKTQYFDGVPQDVWEFHIGGYQVCQKWLKDRKDRQLTHDDIQRYQHIVANLAETIRLMEAVDDVIDEHGGWPLA